MGERAFEAYIAHQDGCAVVKVRGEVDMDAAPHLDAVVVDALRASRHVVFEMSDVTFLDSSGLRSISITWQQVQDGGSVTIRNAPESVSRVFKLAGIESLVAFDTAGAE